MTPVTRNASLMVLGESWWGFQSALVASSTVLTLLLRHHGAGPSAIALIAAIDTGLMLLPQALGPFIFTARRGRKRQLVLWHLFPMIPCLFLLAAVGLWGDRLPAGWAPPLILAAWAGFIGCIGIVSAVWVDWVAGLFPERIRGTVMGISWGASSGIGIVGGLAGGWGVERFPAPQVFAALYILAGVGAMLSISCFLLMRDPADTTDAPPRPMTARLLIQRSRQSLAHPNVRSYLLGRTVAWMGFAWVPFVAVHYAGSGLSDATIVSAGAALTLGGAIGCLGLGRLGDAHGHRLGSILGIVAQCLALITLFLVPGLPGCLIAFTCAGIAGAGITISHNNVLLETCPHDDRVSHLVALNLLCGVVGLLVPLIAGPVVAAYGLPVLFGSSLALSLAGLAWLVLAVREPRSQVTNV